MFKSDHKNKGQNKDVDSIELEPVGLLRFP